MTKDAVGEPRMRDRATALLQAAAAQFAPHRNSIRAYRRLAAILLFKHGHGKAMEMGVGGNWAEVGRLELLMLKYLGLKDGDFIMDVGCGSGRLATAIGAADVAVDYHGSDVVPAFLRNARHLSPKHFRFTRVDRIEIPERDNAADFVTFFSLATHLQLHETYLYLQEAHRVTKPGGIVVVSFLDLGNANHFRIFQETAEAARNNTLAHLNNFFDETALKAMAHRLGLVAEHIFPADIPFIPADEGLKPFGQSVAVLRKK